MLAFLIFNFSFLFLTYFLNFRLVLTFLSLSLFLWVFYFPLDGGVSNLSLVFSCDNLSYTLVFLTLWVLYLGVLARGRLKENKVHFFIFIFLVLFLLFTLLVTFLCYDIILFYFAFEASLIPLLIIIVGYGFQPEKLRAGLYILFYTIIGSLPLLLGLILGYFEIGGSNFFFYSLLFNELAGVYFFFIYLAFFIKLPGYLFHLWLPKAHVEAPVFGSMILAGVMLKIGGYGIIRLIPLFVGFISLYGDLIISFFLGGGVVISIVCLVQRDLKGLVAYSSVGHIGIFVGGLFSLSVYGYIGSLVIMLAHGFTSSGLFSLVNIVYERFHSRSLFMIRGLLIIIPSLSFLWFLFSISNIAAPPFLNLLGELFLSFGVVGVSSFFMLPLGLIFFLAGGYSLYFFSISQHGKF